LALAAAAMTRQKTYADTRLTSTIEESNLINNSFSYQGRLSDNGQTANGVYDFQSYIFTAAENGILLEQHSSLGTPVTSGLFQLEIAIDPAIFTSGGQRWLEIWVSPAGENNWTTLTPRQEILPVPQAIYAEYAGQLANPGETIIQVSPFDALESDGFSSLSFAAKGNGRLEITRSAQGNSFVYIPVDVPAQLFGSQQQLSLESMRFCYSGFNNGFGVVAGIVRATVRQINNMSAASNMVGAAYTPTLVGTDECVIVDTNTPVAVNGSLWVRFEVEASDLIPLELGEISLTFTTGN
jgi:hypothetical protein